MILSFIMYSFSLTIPLIAADSSATTKNNPDIKNPGENYFILEKNEQKPFDLNKELSFKLLQPCIVKLTIYNITGQEIRTLCSGYFEMGSHELVWDGNDNTGKPVMSGVYRYSLRIQDVEQSHLIAYLR